MPNLTATIAPTQEHTTMRQPASIVAARVLWSTVAAAAVFTSATSFVMVIGGIVAGTSVAPTGDSLLVTVINAVMSTLLAVVTVTATAAISRGDAHARRILVAVAAALLLATILPGASLVAGTFVTVIAALGVAATFLPTAARFIRSSDIR